MGERPHPLRPFIGQLRRDLRAAVLGIALGFLAAAAAVGLLSLSGWFISSAALAGLAPATAHLFNFFLPSIGVRMFAVARTLLRYAERLVSHDATFRILEGLRVWFYRRIEPLAPAGLWRFRSGDVLNRIVADVDALDNLYLRVLQPTAVAGLVSGLMFVLLYACDRRAAIAGWLLLSAAGVGACLAAARAGAAAGRVIAGRTAELRTRLVEGLQGLAEITLFGAEAAYRRSVQESQAGLVAGQRRMAAVRGGAEAAVHAVLAVALVSALYLGCERAADGGLDGARLAVVALVVMAAFETIIGLPAAYQFFGRTAEAGRRLLEVVETRPAVAFAGVGEPMPEGFDLVFEHVRFRYRQDMPAALEGVTLAVPQGRWVAVVGESGAGKSTLVNLLVRFFDPESGRIRIGGVDIRTLSEAALRRAVVVVSQDSHLFSATIRENLLIGDPGADEAKLRSALAAVQMLDVVDGMPEGLDTWVGAAGRQVSAGQARRIAVARAVLRDAPIWLLDEPSEGLDRDTERQLMDALWDLTRQRTVVFITHRMVTLERMEAVVVLEAGRVADQGPHAELLARNPRYARWCARMR
jgi:ATP-binding cassette subfamily C protein CydC